MVNNSLRLHDVIHSNRKLVLVFEFVEQDLKKFMNNFKDKGLDPPVIKVTTPSAQIRPPFTFTSIRLF